MIERARSGEFVVRLKGGGPFVFAGGYEGVLVGCPLCRLSTMKRVHYLT